MKWAQSVAVACSRLIPPIYLWAEAHPRCLRLIQYNAAIEGQQFSLRVVHMLWLNSSPCPGKSLTTSPKTEEVRKRRGRGPCAEFSLCRPRQGPAGHGRALLLCFGNGPCGQVPLGLVSGAMSSSCWVWLLGWGGGGERIVHHLFHNHLGGNSGKKQCLQVYGTFL